MKSLVCIPTYNERENIGAIVPEVLEKNPEVHVLVVDDNSPDGTADHVREMMKTDRRIFLLSRPGKQGLGRAYLAAFAWALEQGYDLVVEMDADFSHRPVDLQKVLKAAEANDFVIGSRYVSGGGTQNWSLIRKLISRGGSIYSRLILGFPVNDWTGGFNAWTSKTLHGIGLSQVSSNGYSFQIELKFRALKKGFRVKEVPILFEERRVGASKMSMNIVLEAFWRVWLMRLNIK